MTAQPRPSRDLHAALEHTEERAADATLLLAERQASAAQAEEIRAYLEPPQDTSLFDMEG